MDGEVLSLTLLLWNVRSRLEHMAAEDWRGPKPSHISEAEALVAMINTVIPPEPTGQEAADGGRVVPLRGRDRT